MVDLNWFYSSLAQAAAAIVGIIGGFVLAALLRQRDAASYAYTQLIADARTLKTQLEMVTSERLALTNWISSVNWNEAAIGQTLDVANVPALGGGIHGGGPWVVAAGDAATLATLSRDAAYLVGLIARGSLAFVNDSPKRHQAARTHLSEISARELALHQSWTPATDGHQTLAIGGNNRVATLLALLDKFDSVRQALERRLIPSSFRWGVVLLFLLAALSVVLPLERLTTESPEGLALLGVFTVLLFGLVLFILWQLVELRRLLKPTQADLDSPI